MLEATTKCSIDSIIETQFKFSASNPSTIVVMFIGVYFQQICQSVTQD